jgi:hypothetical protein
LAIQLTLTEESRIVFGNLWPYFGQHANNPYHLNLAISKTNSFKLNTTLGHILQKRNPFYELLAGQNNCCQVDKRKMFLATKEKH